MGPRIERFEADVRDAIAIALYVPAPSATPGESPYIIKNIQLKSPPLPLQ